MATAFTREFLTVVHNAGGDRADSHRRTEPLVTRVRDGAGVPSNWEIKITPR
jgi:hypothetical protein